MLGQGPTTEARSNARIAATRGLSTTVVGRVNVQGDTSCCRVITLEARWKQVGVVRAAPEDQETTRLEAAIGQVEERAETRRAASDRETRYETHSVSRERTIAREIRSRICRERGARMS